MEQATDLTGFAFAVLAALGCGMVMARLRQPVVVGYLVAGALLGPSAFGVVTDLNRISGLAEIGVLLLLFAVGAALSLRPLTRAWRTALPVAGLQILASVAVMLAVSRALGFPSVTALLLGFVVALSGPAITIGTMAQTGTLHSRAGRLALAVLLAQALAFLPMAVILRRAGADGVGLAGVLEALFAAGLMAVFVGVLANRRVELPFARIVIGGADLSALSALAYCFGASALFGLVGLPPAYGAFLAGLLVGNSIRRKAVSALMRPIGGVLALAFFLAIGLLLDLRFVWNNLGTVLVLLAAATLVRTALNVVVFRALRESWPRAFVGGTLLSQPGELGFLLAVSGLAAGAIGVVEMTLAIAVIVLGLCLGPFWLAAARRGQRVLRHRRLSLRDIPPDALTELIVRGRLSAARRAALRRRGMSGNRVAVAAPRRRAVLALPGLFPGWSVPLGHAPASPRRAGPPDRSPEPPPPRPAAPPFAASPAGSIAEIGAQVRQAAGFDLDRRQDPGGGDPGETPTRQPGGGSGA